MPIVAPTRAVCARGGASRAAAVGRGGRRSWRGPARPRSGRRAARSGPTSDADRSALDHRSRPRRRRVDDGRPGPAAPAGLALALLDRPDEDRDEQRGRRRCWRSRGEAMTTTVETTSWTTAGSKPPMTALTAAIQPGWSGRRREQRGPGDERDREMDELVGDEQAGRPRRPGPAEVIRRLDALVPAVGGDQRRGRGSAGSGAPSTGRSARGAPRRRRGRPSPARRTPARPGSGRSRRSRRGRAARAAPPSRGRTSPGRWSPVWKRKSALRWARTSQARTRIGSVIGGLAPWRDHARKRIALDQRRTTRASSPMRAEVGAVGRDRDRRPADAETLGGLRPAAALDEHQPADLALAIGEVVEELAEQRGRPVEEVVDPGDRRGRRRSAPGVRPPSRVARGPR